METVVITGGSLLADEINDDIGSYSFPCLKIENTDYKELIGQRGLRYLTDATKMSLVTMDMSKEQAQVGEFVSERCGIVVATNFSSLATIYKFDMETLTDGPRAVSAMQGPNLVLNATAAMLGIHFNITGFNTTISSGRVASLDALEYAYEMIQKNEVDMAIVTGVEEKTKEYQDWLIDFNIMGSDDVSLIKQLSGTVILESESHARARGAKIYGRIINFSSTFNSEYLISGGTDVDDSEDYNYMISQLIDNIEEVENICVSDNRLMGKNNKELKYISETFPQAKIISAYDVFGGELFGATGMAQLLHSLHTFEPGKGIIFNNDWTGNFRGILLEKVAKA